MGIAQGGTAINSGDNLMVLGEAPTGIAVQGQVVYQVGTPPPNWSLLTHGTAIAPTVNITLDTTGASLLIATGPIWGAWTPTDSFNNTWVQGTDISGNNSAYSRIYYSINPNTGPGHVFTFPNIAWSAYIVVTFAGPTTIQSDQSSTSNITNTTSVQMPAIDVAANSLVITSITNNSTAAGTTSIDSGFTISDIVLYGAVAYLIQSSAATIEPTWTITSAPGTAASMLSFKPT